MNHEQWEERFEAAANGDDPIGALTTLLDEVDDALEEGVVPWHAQQTLQAIIMLKVEQRKHDDAMEWIERLLEFERHWLNYWRSSFANSLIECALAAFALEDPRAIEMVEEALVHTSTGLATVDTDSLTTALGMYRTHQLAEELGGAGEDSDEVEFVEGMDD